jgi:integrase/recombinase XerD
LIAAPRDVRFTPDSDTEIYTRGDPTEKLDAMESIVPPHLRRGAFQPSDRLIALLKRTS